MTDAVARTTEQVSNGIDQFSSRVIDGMQEYGKQTAWAKDLMVVDTFRRINLPVARASQHIAGRVVEVSRLASERIVGHSPRRPGQAGREARPPRPHPPPP